MKKVILSLILVLSTVMSMAQSLDISNGKWTIDSLTKEKVDTILVDATSCPAVGLDIFNEYEKLRLTLSMLNIDVYTAPDGNRLHNYLMYSLPLGNPIQYHYTEYVFRKIERKGFKTLKKKLKNSVVVFYMVNIEKEKIPLDENIVI